MSTNKTAAIRLARATVSTIRRHNGGEYRFSAPADYANPTSSGEKQYQFQCYTEAVRARAAELAAIAVYAMTTRSTDALEARQLVLECGMSMLDVVASYRQAPAPRPISFNVTPAEKEIIQKIAARAVGVLAERGELTDASDLVQRDIEMDITATHKNGCPLRLQSLLDADGFNFDHDFYGIRNLLDRRTGQLPEYFSPRFHAKQNEACPA